MTSEPPTSAHDDFPAFEETELMQRRGAAWWGFFGTVAIVLGALLVPIAVVSTWAGALLSDTDTFVDTLAPLAAEPSVQQFLGEQALAALESQVDLDAAAASPADLAATLSLPPVITDVLSAIGGEAADALREVLRRNVAEFAASPAFATAWTEALRVTHQQLADGLAGADGAVVAVSADAGLGVQLGPIVAAARTWLVDGGFGFAALIPDVDRVVDVVPADEVAPVLSAIRIVESAANWTPWAAIVLLVLGVLLLWFGRRDPSRVVAGAAIAVALSAGLLLLVLGVGRFAFGIAVSAVIPGDVGDAAAAVLLDPPAATGWLLLWSAIGVSVLGFLSAALRLPTRLAAGFRAARRPVQCGGSVRPFDRASTDGCAVRRRWVAARVVDASVLRRARAGTTRPA